MAVPAPASAQTTTSAPPEVTIHEAVTVTVWNRPLVVLRAAIGELTPEHRANQIQARIEALPAEVGEVRASPATLAGLEGILVTVDETMVLGILQQDLDPESTETLEDVGNGVERQLSEILQARREQQQGPLMLRRAAISIGAAAMLIVFLVLLVRLQRFALRLLNKWMERPLSIHGFDLRAAVARLVSILVKGITVIAALTAIESWLAFALFQFPYTRPWGQGLQAYLIGLVGDLALGAVRAVPGLFTAAVIFIVARFISGLVTAFFASVEKGELHALWLEAETARATRRLAAALIWVFAITAAYPYLPGAHTDAFKGVSVFLGLMISLGGVSFVNQVMSGLVVVYSRTFKIGDYVKVGDREGIVTEIGTLSTKIRTQTREEITVPNAVLAGTTVSNYSRLAGEKGSVVRTSVTIGYDTSWRQVHALLELAAERTAGVRRDSKPTVLQRALSDFYAEYEVLAHIEVVESRLRVLSDLHANIQDAFNEYGVQIMSPHFRDQPEGKVFVPKEQWATPPANAETTSGS